MRNKKKTSEWSRLDNAAKIFPPNSNKSDTKVFRFACELKESVDKKVLQDALDITIEQFPLYRSIIKSGLFWYYFERSNIKPIVTDEDIPPCSTLYDKNNKTLLFRVMYFNNRINVEVYHALSDGAGAIQFSRTLVYHYLKIKHKNKLSDVLPLDIKTSRIQKMDDAFAKYYSNKIKTNIKKERIKAYRIKGPKVAEYRFKIIEGVVPIDSLLKIVKEHNTTITIFLAAILMKSISEEIPVRHKNKSVILSIPVNLRSFWSSETARNFFSVINVDYNFKKGSDELQDIINYVQKRFKEKLTPEKLGQRLNTLASLEHNFLLRAIPLAIKNLFLVIANKFVDKSYTSTLTNVGKINVPNEMKQYISSFDLFVATNKLQAAVISYENHLRISFTSAFISTEIQRRFFNTLTCMGIPVDILSNNVDLD